MRIKELNSARDEAKRLRDRISSDLRSLSDICSSMENEVRRRYYEEISRADGNVEGLDEFEEVSRILKRDVQAVNGALAIVSGKIKCADGYNFEEE